MGTEGPGWKFRRYPQGLLNIEILSVFETAWFYISVLVRCWSEIQTLVLLAVLETSRVPYFTWFVSPGLQRLLSLYLCSRYFLCFLAAWLLWFCLTLRFFLKELFAHRFFLCFVFGQTEDMFILAQSASAWWGADDSSYLRRKSGT